MPGSNSRPNVSEGYEVTSELPYNSSNHYGLRYNRFSTVNPNLPPVIGAPRSCCGHFPRIYILLPPWFAVCAPYATPCSVPEHSYCCTLFCPESYIFQKSSRHFLFRVFWRMLSSELVEQKQKIRTATNQKYASRRANFLPCRLHPKGCRKQYDFVSRVACFWSYSCSQNINIYLD